MSEILNNPLFHDFVQLSHERFGCEQRTVEDATTDEQFVKWFNAYLADGCGVAG